MAISHWSGDTGGRFDEKGKIFEFIPARPDHL
jgi:hypothetical protein